MSDHIYGEWSVVLTDKNEDFHIWDAEAAGYIGTMTAVWCQSQ